MSEQVSELVPEFDDLKQSAGPLFLARVHRCNLLAVSLSTFLLCKKQSAVTLPYALIVDIVSE